MFHWRARDLDVPVVVSHSDLADLPEPGWTTFLTDEAFCSRCCAWAWMVQTRRSTTPSTVTPWGLRHLGNWPRVLRARAGDRRKRARSPARRLRGGHRQTARYQHQVFVEVNGHV